MPREIKHSLHPHTLIQKEVWNIPTCAICEEDIVRIGYYCSISDSCNFQIHVGCAQSAAVVQRSAGGERSRMNHPSHPQHELTLLWRPGRSCLFRCDACNTVQKGSSYICIVCQYWIHESCAALPATLQYHHHRDHPLSLAYQLPLEYIKYNFKCDACFKDLLPIYWVYHCALCRYVVHINCAMKTSPAATSIDTNVAVDKDVVAFPINNEVEELIGPFVMKVGGANVKAIHQDNPEIVNSKYKFHNHDHELRLVLSSSLDDQEIEEEEDSDDDDDDDLNYRKKSEIICDGCTTPIFEKKQRSSSSSSKKYCNYYMSCSECKYFLHWACFNIPPELPSHPLLHHLDHSLILETPPKLDLTYCSVCNVYTNGLFYQCTECEFKVDIKCASLPGTIKHVAHPHHLKLISRETTRESSYIKRLCGACGRNTYADACYRCDICQLILHSSCALLPAAVTQRRWDRQPLPLTFDASANHPSGFYCDVCEGEMNPKTWMYHCRNSDISIHPRCFPTASGEYRNIKFGQRYVVTGVHDHPVAYQLLTVKLHCDVCGYRKDYGCRGFQCDSDKCDFFMCLNPCGKNQEADFKIVG
ncbi:hypothetical protein C2S52_021086 [Perilla frutescens var. hirtella]|nr:hypothetical protein C2S52_021086 [Perilla frutescens var. hirtella]